MVLLVKPSLRRVMLAYLAAALLLTGLFAASAATAQTTESLPAPKLVGPSVPQPVKLTWLAVTNAGRYWLQISDSPIFDVLVINNDHVIGTAYSVGGLKVGVPYFWRVKALSDTAVSDWSPVWAFTTSPIQPPPAPTLVSPPNGAASVLRPVRLGWNVAERATSYWLQVSTAQNFSMMVVNTSTGSKNYFDALNLEPNTTYYWHVIAQNDGGTSPWSATWSFTTASGELPGTPTLFTPANGAGDVKRPVHASWSAVANATRYWLQASTAENFSTLVVNTDGVLGTQFDIQGLAGGTKYYWRVKAASPAGFGPWSLVWNFTTAAGELPAVPVLLNPASGVTVPRPVHVEWAAAAGAQGYILQVSALADFGVLTIIQEGITSTSADLTGLLANTKYYWRVRAGNSAGLSNWSTVRWFNTQPESSLTAPVLAGPSNNATNIPRPVHLTWNPVTGATRYFVQVATIEDFSVTIVSTDAVTKPVYDLFSLAASTKHFWRVRAIDGTGPGPWSPIWNFTTTAGELPVTPTLVGPPNGATGVPRPVHITWNPVDTATRYWVQVSTTDSFATLLVNTDGVLNTQFDVQGLAANTTYFWRVKAINPSGVGPASVTWSFTTAAGDVPAVPVLLAPESGATVARPVHLEWAASAGATRYILQISTADGFATLAITKEDLVTVTVDIPGLLANTKYFWRVRAANAAGLSNWSTVRWFQTQPEIVLTAPEKVAPSQGATGVGQPVTLSWNAVANATGYSVIVATDEGLTATVFTEGTVLDTHITLPALAAGTQFFWKVRAKNGTTLGPWSTVWGFTTAQ